MDDVRGHPGQRALRKGRVSVSGQVYLVTTVVRDRAPIFREFHLARVAVRGLRQAAHDEQAQWLAWVLMPDHFHGLPALTGGTSLSTVMGRTKGLMAREVNRQRGISEPLWQPGFHDHALRRDEDLVAAARYVIANPVRAGLVRRVGDYPHWDSVWLE